MGTITAFTLAHSISLARSALGWLSLRPAPVEASIVLVANAALRERHTLARRVPAIVGFGFGLVHGLGFAGALRNIGLPEQQLSAALLGFNLGVQAGQLAAVAMVWALHRLLQRQPWWGRTRRPALYAIGTLAACWCWGRVVAALGWAWPQAGRQPDPSAWRVQGLVGAQHGPADPPVPMRARRPCVPHLPRHLSRATSRHHTPPHATPQQEHP